MATVTVREIPTPRGTARAHVLRAKSATATLVLGHGAGGGVEAKDLRMVTTAAYRAGVTVIRVEQPYRVAGRRSPGPPAHLDEAWLAVLKALRVTGRRPLIVGGRSSGARVACRTAEAAGAAGVLALAFPLYPPGGRPGDKQPRRPSRLDELESPRVPVLVVNGDRDPFGVPRQAPGRTVHALPGQTHALDRDPATLADLVLGWFSANGWIAPPASPPRPSPPAPPPARRTPRRRAPAPDAPPP